MDARARYHALAYRFRADEPARDLVRALEAAPPLATPLALELELCDRHVIYQHSELRDRPPLTILVVSPELPRDHRVRPTYRWPEVWIRPRIDAALVDELEARIAQLEAGLADWQPSWRLARVAPMEIRLPDPGQHAGRDLYLIEDDDVWESVPIAWRGREAWLRPVCAMRPPLALELDGDDRELRVEVRWSTWIEGGPGHADLLALLARLDAAGFARLPG